MKHNHIATLVLILLLSMVTRVARAYPDFISYGYSSCITCHYSGLGGGALNDYGRALFAQEISARHVYPDKMDEEAIAAKSGFAGSAELPWWVRPGLKYRSLWIKRGLMTEESTEQWIDMQTELNLNFFFDKKQNWALITTAGYLAEEDGSYYGKTNQIFAKEYYLRVKATRNLWIYAGQMEKAFGIRQIDHTMVSRAPLGLDMFSQSQGAMVHFTYPTWDVAINAFIGNAAQQDETLNQKGYAITGEYQVVEKAKIGASFLASESDVTRYNLAALSTRVGLSKGTSLMAEGGLKEITGKTSTGQRRLGSFAYIQSLVNITRGYNILSTVENSKSDIENSSPEMLKWSIGAMIFPLPRSEIRAMLTNVKVFDDTGSNDDGWAFQGQYHLSY